MDVLNLVVERAPVRVGKDRNGEDVTIYLDLEDISVLERAEASYKRLNSIMDDVKAPADNASEEDAMTFVADIIRKANAYAKEAIDTVFDTPVSDVLWGNSSCISFGDTPDNSRFGHAMSSLLELYKPAVEKMAGQIEKQSDDYANEVLDAGGDQT